MDKYNERILKLAAADSIEENDKVFLQEIEAANNNPAFAVNEISKNKIIKALDDSIKISKRKKRKKAFLRVASFFLALIVGLSAVTLSVKGFREKLWEFLSNIGNQSYSLLVTSKDKTENKFVSYEGQYIPTWIPDGYEVTEISNLNFVKKIKLENSTGQFISFSEHTKGPDEKLNLDKENFDSYEVKVINGKEIIIAIKNNATTLVIKEKDVIINVLLNDPEINIVGFAELIEEK